MGDSESSIRFIIAHFVCKLSALFFTPLSVSKRLTCSFEPARTCVPVQHRLIIIPLAKMMRVLNCM